MTSVESIQGWMSEIQTTMTSLPSALAAVGPAGNFAAVLSSAQALLDGAAGGPLAGSPTSSTTASGSGTPTTVLAGGGSVAGSFAPATSSLQLGGAATAGPSGSSVVAEAARFVGVPYQWGGTTPAGFDCSGLVQYVYGQLGVALPRTSQQQALVGTPVASLAAAQPGDLVFYAGSDGTPSAPGHVGIYIGNGQMIDAPYTGTTVQIDAVGSPVAIRRVLPAATDPSLAGTAATATPPALAPLFLSAAANYGIPASLLTAVAKVESGFTPNAVSSAGAQGLMQLMPSTAASLGVNPFVPAQAIDGAARLLSGYLQQFGTIPEAVAAYNAGAGAVQQYGGVPPYPQTQAYVQSVMQAMGAGTGSVA